jgi:general secretion pathway protein D
MTINSLKAIRTGLLTVSVAALLTGCVVTDTMNTSFVPVKTDTVNLSEFIPDGKADTEVRQIAAEGIKALDEGRLKDASEAFNVALKLDLTNSYIHFLNAYSYHLRAKTGEVKHYPLAEEGYRQALHFDESNWLAEYYLGLAYMDQRKFKAAQGMFSNVAAYRDDDPEVLYDLATASYYARDPKTANQALKQLREITPENWKNGKVMGVSAMVKAALNKPVEAKSFANRYVEMSGDDIYANKIQRRVGQWQKAYGGAKFQLAQAPAFPWETQDTGSDETDTIHIGEANNNSTIDGGSFVDQQMAVVDVVIIRTEEDNTTSKGVNLLNGLQLQFGDPDNSIMGLSLNNTKSIDSQDSTNNSSVRTLTQQIGIPAVNYSLNIANAFSGRNEILARPSLVALSQQTSEFFSGVEVAAAAVSGGSGDSVSIEKEIGVRLAITPEFLPGDRVKLQVVAERTFLTTPSSSVVFEFRLDTSKTTVNANVAMKFGETLILSGLSEKESENNRDGVPLLQDLPLVQYLFSKATTRDFHKSVLILLTPRRAQYLNQDPTDRENALSNLSEHERQLVEKQIGDNDEFAPDAPTKSIFEHMNTNSLYKQFRTGDIPPERWMDRTEQKKRIRNAIDFLYY